MSIRVHPNPEPSFWQGASPIGVRNGQGVGVGSISGWPPQRYRVNRTIRKLHIKPFLISNLFFSVGCLTRRRSQRSQRRWRRRRGWPPQRYRVNRTIRKLNNKTFLNFEPSFFCRVLHRPACVTVKALASAVLVEKEEEEEA